MFKHYLQWIIIIGPCINQLLLYSILNDACQISTTSDIIFGEGHTICNSIALSCSFLGATDKLIVHWSAEGFDPPSPDGTDSSEATTPTQKTHEDAEINEAAKLDIDDQKEQAPADNNEEFGGHLEGACAASYVSPPDSPTSSISLLRQASIHMQVQSDRTILYMEVLLSSLSNNKR